jgi:peptidase E
VQKRIFAIGGGVTPESVREHLLALTGKERPRLMVVNTPDRENPWATLRTYERLSGRAEVTHVEFFPWPRADLREHALQQDMIMVGGGNTANALAIWRVHGFDAILREAYERGILLAGSSAGMICWFEAGVTDSFGPQLAGMRDGLGFLPGSACPHYDDEELRRPTYRRLIDDEGFPAGYAADAGVGLLFVDGELAEIVTGREGATAYRVDPGSERTLPPTTVLP